MPLCRKNRSASGRAALNAAAASRGWSGVKRPARLAFRTTKLLGRREAASPENGPQAPLMTGHHIWNVHFSDVAAPHDDVRSLKLKQTLQLRAPRSDSDRQRL